MASRRQSFWPWIGQYETAGVCKHIYARVGRGAVAVFDVDSNEALEFLSPRETFAALNSPAVLEVLFELPVAEIERHPAHQEDQGPA